VNILTKLIAAAVVMHGDSAYLGQPVRAKMETNSVDTVVEKKGVRGCSLNEVEKGENREISSTQARVEHAFAIMSGQAGRIFQRYVGRAHNQAGIQMLNLCYNLKCYESILRRNLYPLAAA